MWSSSPPSRLNIPAEEETREPLCSCILLTFPMKAAIRCPRRGPSEPRMVENYRPLCPLEWRSAKAWTCTRESSTANTCAVTDLTLCSHTGGRSAAFVGEPSGSRPAPRVHWRSKSDQRLLRSASCLCIVSMATEYFGICVRLCLLLNVLTVTF